MPDDSWFSGPGLGRDRTLVADYFRAYIKFASAKGPLVRRILEIVPDLQDYQFDYYDASLEVWRNSWLSEEQIVDLLKLGFDKIYEHIGDLERGPHVVQAFLGSE